MWKLNLSKGIDSRQNDISWAKTIDSELEYAKENRSEWWTGKANKDAVKRRKEMWNPRCILVVWVKQPGNIKKLNCEI